MLTVGTTGAPPGGINKVWFGSTGRRRGGGGEGAELSPSAD
jgi:hypothetical protein